MGDINKSRKEAFLQRLAEMAYKLSVEDRANAKALTDYWTSVGFTAGGPQEITDDDLIGTVFEGLTASDVAAVVTSLGTLETSHFAAGHGTNYNKIIPALQKSP